MAKKKNIYNSVEYNQLKIEIDSVVEYLEQLHIEEVSDDIDYRVTQKGGIAPAIVASIETIIQTAVDTIKDASSVLLSIHDKDGMTPYIESKMFTLRGKLKEIQDYYQKRPIASIAHRKISYQSGKDKMGNPKIITFIAATQQQQIVARTRIIKKVLETLPLLDKLEELKEALDVKGDYDIPESFIIRDLV